MKGRSEIRFLLQVNRNIFAGCIMPIAFLRFGIRIMFLVVHSCEWITTWKGQKKKTVTWAQQCSWKLYIIGEWWGCGMTATWQTQLENNSYIFSSSWTLSAGWAIEVWYLESKKHAEWVWELVYDSCTSNLHEIQFWSSYTEHYCLARWFTSLKPQVNTMEKVWCHGKIHVLNQANINMQSSYNC